MKILKNTHLIAVLVIVILLVSVIIIQSKISSSYQSGGSEFQNRESDMLDFKTIEELEAEKTASNSPTPVPPGTPEDTLKYGINGDLPVRCILVDKEINGTLYIYGASARFTGKIARSDFYEKMTDLLSTEKTAYIWNGQTKRGYTFPPADTAGMSEALTLSDEDFSRAMSYLGIDVSSCEIADYEKNLFEVPDYISFSSLSDRIRDHIKEQVSNAIHEGFKKFFGR